METKNLVIHDLSPGEWDKVSSEYAEPFAFPRRLYVWIANINWYRTSIKNGIKPKDMFTRDI